MSWWSSNGASGAAEAVPGDWSWSALPEERNGNGSRPRPDAEPEPPPQDPGYDEGYQDGLAAGEARAAEQLASAVRAARQAARQVQEDQERLADELRDDVLALALGVARHIVGRELRGDAETFADLVREALNAFPLDQKVKIRVHPADLSQISSIADGGEVIPIAGARDVQWLADPQVAEGGCVVEGPERVLDGRLDHTLERIFKRLSHV